MGPGGVNDVMHRKRARRIWEKSVSWIFASKEGWLSELAEALRWVLHVVGEQMEKSA